MGSTVLSSLALFVVWNTWWILGITAFLFFCSVSPDYTCMIFMCDCDASSHRFIESHWFTWATQMSHIPMAIDLDRRNNWPAMQVCAGIQ